MTVHPHVDVYIKTRNHQKTLRKTQENNNLLKTKRTLNTEMEAKWGHFLH